MTRILSLLFAAALLLSCSDEDTSPTMEKDGGVVMTLLLEDISDAGIIKERAAAVAGPHVSVSVDADARRMSVGIPGAADTVLCKRLAVDRGELAIAPVRTARDMQAVMIRIDEVLSGGRRGEYPLRNMLTPVSPDDISTFDTPVTGYVAQSCLDALMALLSRDDVRAVIPEGVVFVRSFMPEDETSYIYSLYAVDMPGGRASVTKDMVEEVKAGDSLYDDLGVVDITLDKSCHEFWERLTGDNVGRYLAMLVDGEVYSSPMVNMPISGGRSQLAGQFSDAEALVLAAILDNATLSGAVAVEDIEIIPPAEGVKDRH